MNLLPRLRFRHRRDFNPNLHPHPTTVEAARRPDDDGLISLSYGGEGTDEDEDKYFTPATSSWSSSSQGSVGDNEIGAGGERNWETEDTASSAQGRIVPEEANNSEALNAVASEGKRSKDHPPTDDCCPICFSGFSVPVRAPCGHWYCGGCILQYWEYGPALQPCKCPMCSQKISNLIPGASLGAKHEPEVAQVLNNVKRYNRLFIGGFYGFILIILGILYTFSPFDFLHIGRANVVDLFDYSAMVLSLVFYVVGLFVRRRRLRRVREIAAVQL